MKMPTVTPSPDWPIGRRVVLLDAYLRNPIEVKVTKHANADHLITEDDRGVVYYARTDRITGFADDYVIEREDVELIDFADILG